MYIWWYFFFIKIYLKKIVDFYIFNGLNCVTLLPTDNGIDNVDFIIKDNKIYDTKYSKTQTSEVSQIFLFNANTIKRIKYLISKGKNRFEIMYKYLLKEYIFNVVECNNNECINLNEKRDLNKI